MKTKNPMESSRKLGAKFAVGVAIPVAACAGLFFALRGCPPKTESIARQCEPCPAAEEKACPEAPECNVARACGPDKKCASPSEIFVPPAKGDGICEVDKGEADPSRPDVFSQSDCGRCGDGIKQVNEREKPVDAEENPGIQYVNGRASETADEHSPDFCPVDLLCNDGRRTNRTAFAAWMEVRDADCNVVKNASGNTLYQLTAVEISECAKKIDVNGCSVDSPFYCAADCERTGGTARVGSPDRPPTTPVRPSSQTKLCRDLENGSAVIASAATLRDRVRNAVLGARPTLRQYLDPTNPPVDFTVTVTARIGTNGVPDLVRASASGSSVTFNLGILIDKAQINERALLNRANTQPPTEECDVPIPVVLRP